MLISSGMHFKYTLLNTAIQKAPTLRGAMHYGYEGKNKGNTMQLHSVSHRRLKTFFSALLFAIFTQCYTLAHADGVDWESLSPQQQETLAPMRENWRELPPNRQERLRQGAERWNSLPPEQRNRLQDRMHRYDNLSPDEKGRIKERMREYRQLSPEERNELRERWRDVPPEQKERIRERHQRDDNNESRRKWRKDR